MSSDQDEDDDDLMAELLGLGGGGGFGDHGAYSDAKGYGAPGGAGTARSTRALWSVSDSMRCARKPTT